MGKITFDTKVDARVLGGQRINKVVAADMNEVKESVNELYDKGADWKQYSTAGRDLLTGVALGYRIFNTTNSRPEYWNGSEWLPISAGLKDISCGGSPNYPAALEGDILQVTANGKIGGTSGKNVFVKDLVVCLEANAGGTDASVGSKWRIVRDTPQLTQAQIDALSSPNTGLLVYNTDEEFYQFYNSVKWQILTESIPLQFTDNVNVELNGYLDSYYLQFGDVAAAYGMAFGDFTSLGGAPNGFAMKWDSLVIESESTMNLISSDSIDIQSELHVNIFLKTGQSVHIQEADSTDVFEFREDGIAVLHKYASLNFADDTAAATGGVPLGGVYHNAGALRVRIV